MLIIGNTSEILETKGALEHYIISHGFTFLQMNFKQTKEENLIWKNIKNPFTKKSKDNKNLSLEDVLTILNEEILLLIELKLRKRNTKKTLTKLIEILKKLKNSQNISISCSNIKILNELLKIKQDLQFELGLTINRRNLIKIIKQKIELEELDFIKVPRRLIKNKIEFLKKLKHELSHLGIVLEYEKPMYKENDEELEWYMKETLDAIIVNEPYTAKRILQKQTLPKQNN